MKILGIETSVKSGSLALIEGEDIVTRADIDTRLNHSARLIPVLNELLRLAGWGIADLDGVGVGLGPGSFYGDPGWSGGRAGDSLWHINSPGRNRKLAGYGSGKFSPGWPGGHSSGCWAGESIWSRV